MATSGTYTFNRVREAVFGGRLSETQLEGLKRVLDYKEAKYPRMDRRELAYVLATAYHESARTMQPVRETLAGSDKEAIRRLDKAFAAGKMPQVKSAYWRDGYFGRGLVQITFKDNYTKFSIAKPEDALTWPVALGVLFRGMIEGMFSGKKLADYIHGDVCDYVGARRIVNGTDRAKLIAGYANAFLDALTQAELAPTEVAADCAEKVTTGKDLMKSTTAAGGAIAGVGGAIAAGKEAVDAAKDAASTATDAWALAASVGPWILLALVVAAAGAYVIYERRKKSRELGV